MLYRCHKHTHTCCWCVPYFCINHATQCHANALNLCENAMSKEVNTSKRNSTQFFAYQVYIVLRITPFFFLHLSLAGLLFCSCSPLSHSFLIVRYNLCSQIPQMPKMLHVLNTFIFFCWLCIFQVVFRSKKIKIKNTRISVVRIKTAHIEKWRANGFTNMKQRNICGKKIEICRWKHMFCMSILAFSPFLLMVE